MLAAGALALAGATQAQAAGTAGVTVTNAGYSPGTLHVPYGTRVVWTVEQGTHTVTDTGRLRLFSSGPRTPGSTYAYRFTDAGTFAYRSTVGPAIAGTVVVPMRLTPASGSRTTLFSVAWGSTSTRPGYSEQVQIRPPGSASWQSFVFGTPDRAAAMRPVDWGNRTGTYQFRAKLYRGSSPAASSGWSPVASISVR